MVSIVGSVHPRAKISWEPIPVVRVPPEIPESVDCWWLSGKPSAATVMACGERDDGRADCLICMQTLELWSLSDSQRNPIQAHEGLVAALAHSPFTGMIASASHDRYVKLWK